MSEHELWNELGNLYFLSGAYDQAIHAYTRSIALERNFGRPYSNLAQAYLQKGRYTETIDLYKRGIVLLDDSREKALSWHKLGNVYRHLKDYSRAVKAYQMADELDPCFRDYAEAGNPADALLNRKPTSDEILELNDDISTASLSDDSLFTASTGTSDLTPFMEELTPWDFEDQVEPPDGEIDFAQLDLWPLESAPVEHSDEVVVFTEPLKWEMSTLNNETAEAAAETGEQETDISPIEEEVNVNVMPEPETESLEPEAITEVGEIVAVALEVENSEVVETSQPMLEIADTSTNAEALISESDFVAEETSEPVTVQDSQPVFEIAEDPQVAEANIPESEFVADETAEPVAVQDSQPVFEIAEDSQVAEANIPESEFVAEEIAEPVTVQDSQPVFEIAEDSQVVEANIPVSEFVAEEIAEPVTVQDNQPMLEFADTSPIAETTTTEPEFVDEETTSPEAVQYEIADNSAIFEAAQNEASKRSLEIGRMKRVLEINPQNAFAWDTIGRLYKTAGQYDAAIHAYQNAISIDPTRVFYYFHIGLIYAAAGKYDDAIEAFKLVIEREPDHGLAHATLGGYYRRQGRDDLAEVHLERARELLADDENEYNRACMAAISGNSDRALELLELALKNKQTHTGWVVRDPDLDFVRSDPRFYALLNEYASRPVN